MCYVRVCVCGACVVCRMQGSRVEPNLITYNALIHACAQVSPAARLCPR